jgi:hypothetical protein
MLSEVSDDAWQPAVARAATHQAPEASRVSDARRLSLSQETKAILYMYPQVYADLAVINWIIPREEFHDYLQALVARDSANA